MGASQHRQENSVGEIAMGTPGRVSVHTMAHLPRRQQDRAVAIIPGAGMSTL